MDIFILFVNSVAVQTFKEISVKWDSWNPTVPGEMNLIIYLKFWIFSLGSIYLS